MSASLPTVRAFDPVFVDDAHFHTETQVSVADRAGSLFSEFVAPGADMPELPGSCDAGDFNASYQDLRNTLDVEEWRWMRTTKHGNLVTRSVYQHDLQDFPQELDSEPIPFGAGSIQEQHVSTHSFAPGQTSHEEATFNPAASRPNSGISF